MRLLVIVLDILMYRLSKIIVLLIQMLKTTRLFKLLTLKAIRVKDNKVVDNSGKLEQIFV